MSPIASTQPAPSTLLAPRASERELPSLRWLDRFDERALALLLALAWLPSLAAALLWVAALLGSGATGPGESLGGATGLAWLPRWAPPLMQALALLASTALAGAAWRALSQRLQRLRGAADGHAHAAQAAAVGHAQTLGEVHTAQRLQHAAVDAAVGELARRTVALCGMLDANMQDAARAAADLEAIQDEERHALQLMSALRARLLSLAQHCQDLTEAAAATAPSQLDASARATDELGASAHAEMLHCHQLSERAGGAERLNERRIESMRRGTERLQFRAERALLEGQQLMVLTRQIQAVQAAALRQLEAVATPSAATAGPTAAPPVASASAGAVAGSGSASSYALGPSPGSS